MDLDRWARFMWYARFVRTIRIIGTKLESKHRELVYALVEHNGDASVFPSLQELQWAPSSRHDSSHFPLFTPQLYTAAFTIPGPTKEDPCRLDQDSESHTFLARLQETSPRLRFLSVDASWQRLGEHHILAVCSFSALINLRLVSTISTSSFSELAAMPHLKCLEVGHVDVWCDGQASPPSPCPARIFAPRLLFLTIFGESNLLATLFTALRAPVLRAATVTAIYNDSNPPRTGTGLGYVRCLKALASFPLEETKISLLEPISPTRMHLAALLNPLLRLPGVTYLALSCPKLRLVADDDDFAAIARAWPRLRTFRLTRAHWDAFHAPGSGDDVPTPEALRVFCDLCPDLRDLVLPYLDLDARVPQLGSTMQAGSPHGLKHLVFGAKAEATNNDEQEARARELAEGRGPGLLERDKVEEWARYILDLFPKLNTGRSLADCVFVPAASGWIEVLRRVQALRSSRMSMSSEETSDGVIAKLSG
ncbi:hypothetical protein GSI_12265 [Ganoderma sinense ZZ0214-1]|uniref:F-box domain-containing protein n=1 Tax=Ganoderma sinense ZZ0214-1 TaxID=1077348 RepID=A0A2G8RYE6_9APHY|nr:hypothetical protein GSI_12265 [Ganoderma sinense ZZ0214-1]